jgi:hypothetical protein
MGTTSKWFATSPSRNLAIDRRLQGALAAIAHVEPGVPATTQHDFVLVPGGPYDEGWE